ncbi:MAG: hypothetical protein WBY53_02845 [Acidobacteriaceae bacterium]
MLQDEEYRQVAHTVDVVWMIALWHWIHGGDPLRDQAKAETTELMARALVSHLSEGETGMSGDAIEKLNQLGILISVKEGDQRHEVTSTRQFHELMTAEQGKNRPIPCALFPGDHLICGRPIWDFPFTQYHPWA